MLRMGRPDVDSEGDAVHHDKETYGTSLIVDGLNKANLSPDEYVALMGIHTLGFVGQAKKGTQTRWCMNPYVFDNTYFKELMLGDQSKYFRTDADRRLLHDSKLKPWVETYAQDQTLFFANYAKAHVKVSEMTFEKTLASEIEPQNWIDGGYQEPRRPLLQGFYQMLGRYQDRQAHAQISTGHEEHEEEEVEDHDDHHDEHHDEHQSADHHDDHKDDHHNEKKVIGEKAHH